MNMAKSKRFQSGREIFEQYIPEYEPEDVEKEDVSEQADRLAEAILNDFSANLAKAQPARANR